MDANMISLKNISKVYGEKKVLDNLSLDFPIGEISGIMAPSGAGKTTLLRILAALENPDSGEIYNLPESISMVFQEDRLLEHLDGVSNVILFLSPDIAGNQSKEAVRDYIADNLEVLGISRGESMGKPVSEYSGGMRRRVALLRALMAGSKLILLDEPFKGLDDETKDKAISFVKNWLDKGERPTVIMVSHDRDEIDKLGCEPGNFHKI